MTAARDAILGKIRLALMDVGAEGASADAPIPRAYRQTGTLPPEDLVAGFVERAEGYKVRCERVARADVPTMAARLLNERQCRRLVVPTDLPDPFAPAGFDLISDAGLDNATIAASDGVLTTCACAIAQTGSIVLDHGVGQGRRVLTLLPDYHLCIVETEQIVEFVTEAVLRVAAAVAAGRPLTFISGPSATSDIELSRVEGVHGPRTLDVIIVV